MISSRSIALAASLFMLAACENPTADPVDPEIEALSSGDGSAMIGHVDAQLRALVQREDLPSLSAAIVRSDGTVEYFSYGTLERGQDAPVKEDTLFQIASLSKLLTGVVTNSLIRSGQLDPDAPATTYLGSVLGAQTNASLDNITTQHLLNHRAGIENEDCSLYSKREEGEAWLDGYSRAQLITDLRELSLPDGGAADFSYSSCGYAVVGLIGEIVSGQTYAELLAARVTTKHDMPDTAVVLNADQQSRLATPYRKDDRQVATQASNMGMGTPGSAVYSSAQDLARLQTAQLAAYREYAATGEETDLILSKRMVKGHREDLRFGTGIIELSNEHGTIYLHDGDADGFASLYAFAPEQDVGIVMLTGSGGDIFVETGLELLTLLMASENAAMKSEGS